MNHLQRQKLKDKKVLGWEIMPKRDNTVQKNKYRAYPSQKLFRITNSKLLRRLVYSLERELPEQKIKATTHHQLQDYGH